MRAISAARRPMVSTELDRRADVRDHLRGTSSLDGLRPAIIRNSTQPIEKMSVRRSAGGPPPCSARTCSQRSPSRPGHRSIIVGEFELTASAPGSASSRVRSRALWRRPSVVTMMFSGLMSGGRYPPDGRSQVRRDFRGETHPFAKRLRSRAGQRLAQRRAGQEFLDERGYCRRHPTSCTTAMFEWLSAAAARASCSNRASRRDRTQKAAGRILIATSRSRRVSRAR